jgi:hypothetical protein
MSGHCPSRNWEGPKKAGAKSRGRTRRFFVFSELYSAVVRVLVAIALLAGFGFAADPVEQMDACGKPELISAHNPPRTTKEKAEREKWMGTIRFTRVRLVGTHLPAPVLSKIITALQGARYAGIESQGEISERARDQFQSRGYFEVEIMPEFKIISGTKCFHHISATFNVHQGNKFRLGSISFKNAKAAFSNNDLRKLLPMENSEVFDTSKVRLGLEQLRKAYAKLGYIDFTAVPDTKIHRERRLIDLTLDLDEGKQFRVRQIGVAGLTDERFQQFYALFPLKEGALYDPGALEQFFERHREFLQKNFQSTQDLDVSKNDEAYTVDLRIDLSGYHIRWPDRN